MNKLKVRATIAYSFYTPFAMLFSLIKGIKIRKYSYFWGMPYFFKQNNSSIEIGRKCRFNSISTSNLIGINHRCILSTLEPNATLKIGNNCGFSGTTIGCFKSIIIGDNVKCGANTLITDSDWHVDDYRSSIPCNVVIGNNVWLGYGSIVLKGVTIGENSVIGAGSVVTKDIPSNVVAAGNPCKVIKLIS